MSSTSDNIDRLNVEMAKYNDVYPAALFVQFWDGAHAVMSKVMDMTRKVAENPKVPASVKADARASGERLVDSLAKMRQADDFVVLASRARCTANPPCPSHLAPLSTVTAPGFRSLSIEVLRQAERTRETCEYILREMPGMASLIFSFNEIIDNWIASRIDAATAHLDPYITQKTEEAIEKASAEASAKAAEFTAKAEQRAEAFAQRQKASAKAAVRSFVFVGLLVAGLTATGVIVWRLSRKGTARTASEVAGRRVRKHRGRSPGAYQSWASSPVQYR